MRKTMYKSVLAVIAAGLLSVGMATAETLDTPDTTDQAGSTKTLKLGHNFKNVEPRTDSLQWHFHDWPIENTKKAHTFNGKLLEAAKKLPYEAEAPSYIPYGYEIYTGNFQAIRNPIYRQMLRMQEIPSQEYTGNSRGVDLRKNFPTQYYQRKQVMQQPASENETKALIRIFQEYPSCGLLSFDHFRNRILYFKQSKSFAANQKSYRLARHLQKCSSYYMENSGNGQGDFSVAGRPGTGSPEQFYAEICHKPSFRIETLEAEGKTREEQLQSEYRKIHTLPLEYLFSL